MPGVGFNLSQSLKQQQTLAPQMRQGLKMLQMTSLELRAELQHEMEVNPVIEDVTSRIERQMSSELPDAHSYGEVTEKPLEFGTGENMASAMGTDATDDGYRDYFLGNMESASGDEEAQSRRDHLFDSMVKTETLQQHLMAQIGLSDIPQEDRDLAGILVENVDDDGYFRGSIPDIKSARSIRWGAGRATCASAGSRRWRSLTTRRGKMKSARRLKTISTTSLRAACRRSAPRCTSRPRNIRAC